MRLLILALLLCLNASAVINRYVNTASTAGGDGTTNATSGANRAWATLNEALTTLDNAPLTDDVTVFCSGSTADTTAITQINVNTSTYTLTIQGDRTGATWDTSKYRLEVSSGSYAFRNNTTLRMKVFNLQIKMTMANAYAMSLIGANHAGTFAIEYARNIVWSTSKSSTIGITCDPPASGSGTAIAYNNIVYGFGSGFSAPATSFFKAYNNTVADSDYGYIADGAWVSINNLSNATQGFVGTFDASSNYNAEADAGGGAPGANSRGSQTFTFVNAAGSDYRLSLSDAGARNYGVSDPGSGLFSTDITGYTRTGSWDIGASEAHLVVALTGTATSSIAESDIVTGGKTIILTADGDMFVPTNGTPAYSAATTKGTTAADSAGGGGGSTGDGNLTCTFPSSYTPVAGHFALMIVYLDQGAASTPTNWSAVTGSPFGGGTEKLAIFYKVLAGGESDPVTTISGSTTGASNVCNMAIYTGVGSIGTVGTASNGTGTPMTAGGITTSTDGSIIVFAAGRGDNENASSQTINSSATGVTERLDGGTAAGNDSQVSMADKTITTAGATGDGSSTTSATDPWVAVIIELVRSTPFASARAAIISGLDSAQSEGTGWDAVVKAGQGVSGVVRTSDTVCTITLDAFASYNITAQETITATLPAAAFSGNTSAVASPTFTITAAAGAARRRVVIVQ